MAAVTICSDFVAPQNKVSHCFHCFPIYLPWSDGTRCMILVFWMLSFKPTFSLSSFTLSRGLLVTECYIKYYPKYIKIITLKQYGYQELLLTNKGRLVFLIIYSTKYLLLDSYENWYSLATLIFPLYLITSCLISCGW